MEAPQRLCSSMQLPGEILVAIAGHCVELDRERAESRETAARQLLSAIDERMDKLFLSEPEAASDFFTEADAIDTNLDNEAYYLAYARACTLAQKVNAAIADTHHNEVAPLAYEHAEDDTFGTVWAICGRLRHVNKLFAAAVEPAMFRVLDLLDEAGEAKPVSALQKYM